ncbi:hypothetical protein K2Y00_00960 [Patescibacteria group bacterium]|nr:hypothetical protein [Patescibacteria group bacterium]
MNSNKYVVPALVVLLLVLAGSAAYLYMQVSSLKQDPEALARKEAEELVAVVGKLILLPKDELPTVATVSDPTKLSDQAFFAKAKVGDKVLLYPTSRKAYLYDPKANRVLEVAPINLGDTGPTVTPEEEVEVEAETEAEVTEEPTDGGTTENVTP